MFVPCALLALLFLGVRPAAAQTSWQVARVLTGDRHHELVRDDVRERVLCVSSRFDPLEVFVWDGKRWDRVDASASAPSRREDFGVAFDSSRNVLVLFGGVDPGGTALGETWEWSDAGWTQRFPANAPNNRSLPAMAHDQARGKTVLFGGVAQNGALRNSTWEWDGSDWTRDLRTPVPSKRSTSMVYDEVRQTCLIYSGSPPTWDTWEYDASGWTQRAPAPLSILGQDHALAYDPVRNRTVIHALDDTWEWNGSGWTNRTPFPFPFNYPRGATSQEMAYDAASGRVLEFGGASGWIRPSETHAWDGVRWDSLGANAPDSAHGLALSHDSVRDRVVSFGGTDVPFGPGEGFTFEWDGEAWEEARPPVSPPGRELAALAYDPAGDRTILFGGRLLVDGTRAGDTWEWNGAAWTQLSASSELSPRWRAAMAFDPSLGALLLFGGDDGAPDGETWTLRGNAWVQETPAGAPPPRYGAAMVHEASTGLVLLYGGEGTTGTLGDTWVWNGDWSPLTPTTPAAFLRHPAATYDSHRERIVLVGITGGGQRQTWEWVGGNWLLRTTEPCTSTVVSQVAYHAGSRRTVQYWVEDCSDPGALPITYLYGPDAPASLASFGQGCAGAAGIPALASSRGDPWIGEPFTFVVSGVPFGETAWLAVGSSRTSWGGFPLPLSLSPWGLPGCSLFVSPDLPLAMNPSGPGAAERTLFAPASAASSLAGRAFYAQAVVTDPLANPAGMVLSNALAGVLGVK